MFDQMANNFQKTKNHIVLGLVLYKLSLEICYIFIISPLYGYSGFLLDIDVGKLVLSWIIYIALSYYFKRVFYNNNFNISVIILFCLFILYFTPLISLIFLANLPYIFMMLVCIYWCLAVVLEKIFSKITFISFAYNAYNKNILTDKIADVIILLCCIYMFIFSLNYNKLYINFALENVYNLRLAARDANFSGLSGYLLSWIGFVIAPSAALRYFKQKKWILFSFICYIQLLHYSIAGEKTILAIIPISIFLYIFFSNRNLLRLPFGMFFVNIISFCEYFLLGTYKLSAYIICRTLYFPSLLNYWYYDFFSKNPPDMLKQSVLRRIGLVSTYDIQIPNLIGLTYTNSIEHTANTGMFGDAYANFGILGVVIYPVLMAILLCVFNNMSKNVYIKNYVNLVIIILLFMINGSFFTIILSNGIWLAIVILFFSKRFSVIKKIKLQFGIK